MLRHEGIVYAAFNLLMVTSSLYVHKENPELMPHRSTLKTLAFENTPVSMPSPGGGGGAVPYIGYTGMCRWKGYGFQAICHLV